MSDPRFLQDDPDKRLSHAIEEAGELLAKATPGPWGTQPDDCVDMGVPIIGFLINDDGEILSTPTNGLVGWATLSPVEIDDLDFRRARANAELLCAAVNALPTLLDRIDALTAERDRIADVAATYADFWDTHHASFDAAGNYIPHSQIDGDLRAAEEESERLREILWPFAALAAVMTDWPDDASVMRPAFAYPGIDEGIIVRVRHFLAARAALEPRP